MIIINNDREIKINYWATEHLRWRISTCMYYVPTYMFVFEWKLKRVDEICVSVLDDDEFGV